MNMAAELPWLWAACALVAATTALAVVAGPASAARALAPRLMDAAVLAAAVGLALRWQRLGHGPFVDLFEILASSLFSLGLAVAWAQRRLPRWPAAAPVAYGVLAVLALWLPFTQAGDTLLPPTYHTPLLWCHVLLGKVFLGCALLAAALAGTLLLRGRRGPDLSPAPAVLDRMAWRLMRLALAFETAMLMTGALWAQDAWGRWWSWDPLETWAFMTWLLLVGALHARQHWRVPPAAGAWLIVGVFVLAFLTFFGVPFVSLKPHQGAV